MTPTTIHTMSFVTFVVAPAIDVGACVSCRRLMAAVLVALNSTIQRILKPCDT